MWNSRLSREGGPFCKEPARPPWRSPAPRAAGRPLQAAPLPRRPPARRMQHGGLYGARRQRVARLTLRGKFEVEGKALNEGPPAAAAARVGAAGRAGNVSRAPRAPLRPRRHSPGPWDRAARGRGGQQVEGARGSALSAPLALPVPAPCCSVPRLPRL